MEDFPKAYLYKRIVDAKCFIDSNFPEPIDINNIAEEANFSKYHFIREFKKIYGRPPHKHLQKVRIENAMLLLKAGFSASDVCFKVGLSSPSSFSVLFKKLVGISPSEYSNLQQKIRGHILKEPLDFVPGCFAEVNGWAKKQF